MSGPKHLWSGDWESDSARTAEDLAHAPGPVFDAEPEPAAPAAAARRWSRRQLAVALTTGVAAAALTVGLVSALGGSSPPRTHHGTAAAKHSGATAQRPTGGQAPISPCQQNPTACTKATPVVSGPTADWEGMEIVTSPAGIVISTIHLGSAADRAGLEPGDAIEQINGHPISRVEQIRQDTARIAVGRQVLISVLRASSIPQAAALPMTERPTIHP